MLFLIIGSTLAIIAMVGLMHYLGFSETVRLQSLDQARNLFLDNYPNARLQEQVLLQKDSIALFKLSESGVFGIVRPRGNKWQTSEFRIQDISQMESHALSLVIKLKSFASPKILLNFEDTQTMQYWHTQLTPGKSP